MHTEAIKERLVVTIIFISSDDNERTGGGGQSTVLCLRLPSDELIITNLSRYSQPASHPDFLSKSNIPTHFFILLLPRDLSDHTLRQYSNIFALSRNVWVWKIFLLRYRCSSLYDHCVCAETFSHVINLNSREADWSLPRVLSVTGNLNPKF